MSHDYDKDPTILLDATAARPPCSGVQLSILAETAAVMRQPGHWRAAAFDDSLSPDSIRPPAWAFSALGRALWQQTCLPRILKRGGFAVLHAMAYTCPVHCPVPVLLNVHDVIALEHPDLCSLGNACHFRLLMPPSIKRADAIIVSTNHVANRLHALFPTKKPGDIHVIPLGVDFHRFSTPAPRPDIPTLDPDEPYILFVGNLEPKKGLLTLLKAYRSVATRLNVALILAGRTAWKARPIIRSASQHDAPGKVILTGRVPDAELPGLYQHAAAFVFPSREEGFGMPLLEAMAAGTPVIHSSHPAVCEAAGNAGLSFPIDDANALADAITTILGPHSPADEMRAKGRLHASTHTWDAWAEKAAQLARSIA